MFKKTILAAMALTAASTAFAGKPANNSVDMILDIDAVKDNYYNPTYVYLEAGTYYMTPLSTAEGGKYTARNAWRGAARGCQADGTQCRVGWQHNILISAYELGFSPTYNHGIYGEVGLCRYPAPADSSVRNSTVFGTAELANLIAREMSELYPCSFTIEQSGYVRFSDGDGMWWDNKGGVSYRLTSADQRPGKRLGQKMEHGNNGWGNGDQVAPGNSALHNRAENYVYVQDFDDAE